MFGIATPSEENAPGGAIVATNDSRFVAGETGFEARNPSARGVHAKQEVKD